MTTAAVALLLLFQHLEPSPYPAEAGTEVALRVRDAEGKPLAGVVVQWSHGTEQGALPATDATGTARWVPPGTGDYLYRATLAQPAAPDGTLRLVAPHSVVEPRRRAWLALAFVPLGLALLWANLRRRPPSA